MRTKLWILCLFCFGILACQAPSVCAEIDGIVVSAALQEQARQAGFAYCHVLGKALDKDSMALAQFIRFAYKTDDDTAVEHGLVFSELAMRLGDSFLFDFMRKQLIEQQVLAAKMLDTCLEFCDPPLPLKQALPKTFDLLIGEK